MELHQLRYFVAVVEVGSFSGAARRCNVAQPSLSQQIQKLEAELGLKLFDRLGRKIALTEGGKALLPRARRILTEVREAQHRLVAEIDHGRGTLEIGAIPTIAPYLLPEAITRFRRACPDALLRVREDFTARLVDALVSAEIDLALVSTPIDNDAIEVDVLFDEALLVAVGRDDPLAGRTSLRMGDLARHDTIVLDEMNCLGQQVQDFCRAMQVEQKIGCRTTQMATLQRLVELGAGIALVPQMAADADTGGGRVYLPIQGRSPRRQIAVATRAGREPSRLARTFIEEVAGIPQAAGA
jgi:LysR family hydrogen peroxide-inducible transcriptional activator